MPKAQKIDTTNETVGQDRTFSVGETEMVADVDIQKIDGPELKTKAEILAFMEEPVTVMLHESTDRNVAQVEAFSNDGRTVYLTRGKPQTIRRKFVEVMARCKHTSLGQRNVQDQNGTHSIEYPTHTALKYPFQLIEDKNPKGADWLRRILAEA